MTDKEKAIVMAYTGFAMLNGDKFDIFHKYIEEIMNRPVFTHEFLICKEEIREKAKPDFLKLCEEEEQPHGTCKTCKHYTPYREQFSYKNRGDGYCTSTITTSDGQAYINCHDEWYCANYEKDGDEK